MNEMEFDEETFKQTEERLDRIRSLMAKYGNSEEAVLKSLEEKRERLQELENYEELAALASRELEAQTRSMEQLCGTLSEARKRAARVLEERIGAELMDLNFLHVVSGSIEGSGAFYGPGRRRGGI